jgi:hypothetical protein
MIMALTQHFILKKPDPRLPPEWVCAGCEAPMGETEPAGDAPADSVAMTHTDSCPETSGGASLRA